MPPLFPQPSVSPNPVTVGLNADMIQSFIHTSSVIRGSYLINLVFLLTSVATVIVSKIQQFTTLDDRDHWVSEVDYQGTCQKTGMNSLVKGCQKLVSNVVDHQQLQLLGSTALVLIADQRLIVFDSLWQNVRDCIEREVMLSLLRLDMCTVINSIVFCIIFPLLIITNPTTAWYFQLCIQILLLCLNPKLYYMELVIYCHPFRVSYCLTSL